MLFTRATTDSQQIDCSSALKDVYAGTEPTACVVVGSAPGMSESLVYAINHTSLMRLACNLSGRDKSGKWYIKPHIWTAFDPTGRFCRSIFTDPSIMKFINRFRTHDLVPGGDEKLCDMPNTFFYENENRSFTNFFDRANDGINHSLDSFVQLLDIGFMLGFREFICAGTEMAIRPSAAQIEFAESVGVKYDRETCETVTEVTVDGKTVESRSDLLRDFVGAVSRIEFGNDLDKAVEALSTLDRENQYSFDETKSLKAAMSSDAHYWERVQYLRLSRKTMALNGMKLYCTSNTSRLYPWFPLLTPVEIHDRYVEAVQDDIAGVYSGKSQAVKLPFHRDVKPFNWGSGPQKKPCCGGCADAQKAPPEPVQPAAPIVDGGLVLQKLHGMKQAPVQLNEAM
jgi:hypothetical protein